MLPAISTRRFPLSVFSGSPAFRREVDELFDQFFGNLPAYANGGMTRGWDAPISIWDDAEHVYLEVEVPGLSQNDFEVVMHQGSLRIWGERKAPAGERNYWHNERAYGRFERIISLPDTVDPNSIEARMHDGILYVTLQKKPEAQPKKVTVHAG
jgi:HSP20 family protein